MFSKERNFLEWNLSGFGDSPAILFENLDSTHSLMKAKAAAGEIAPGTLIVADMQTSGRGRLVCRRSDKAEHFFASGCSKECTCNNVYK